MKEIIYTAIFILLGILLILLLIFMFSSNEQNDDVSERQFTPGIYTSTVTLSNNVLEVEVTVDEHYINSIRFSNLDETVTTMYPLIQPAIENIAEQIYRSQSLENLSYSEEHAYTSKIIISAIDQALQKAEVD